MKIAAHAATQDKNYLSLLMRTARIDVKKFSSLIAVPVTVLNRHRRRGDNEGCWSQVEKIKQTLFGYTIYKFQRMKLKEKMNAQSTCSPAPTIARRLELNSISTMLNAPIAVKI